MEKNQTPEINWKNETDNFCLRLLEEGFQVKDYEKEYIENMYNWALENNHDAALPLNNLLLCWPHALMISQAVGDIMGIGEKIEEEAKKQEIEADEEAIDWQWNDADDDVDDDDDGLEPFEDPGDDDDSYLLPETIK